MSISPKINTYLENSKHNRKFLRWKKPIVNIFITPISANISNKNYLYSQITQAISTWNIQLKNNSIGILFNQIQSPQNADIIICWTKVGRVYEGMCKYPGILQNELKRVTIDIGLPNEYSGKNTTPESIFFVIMHELGHSLGLGHGVEIDDLMFVPHQKNIALPSENDLFVLKTIYS